MVGCDAQMEAAKLYFVVLQHRDPLRRGRGGGREGERKRGRGGGREGERVEEAGRAREGRKGREGGGEGRREER